MKLRKKRILSGLMAFVIGFSVWGQDVVALESPAESMIQESMELTSDEGGESQENAEPVVETIAEETESEESQTKETDIQETETEEVTENVESTIEETQEVEELPETIEVDAAALSPVTNFKAVKAGRSRVKLSWDAVEGADAYIIYRQVGKGKSSYLYITKNLTYVDTSASGLDYNFYWVYPCYTDVSGQRIVGICPKYVYAKAGLDATSNVTAKACGKSRVQLTWRGVSGADGYIIYRQVGKGTYKYRGMTQSLSYVDTTASDLEYNFYWVYPYYKENGQNVANTAAKYVYAKGGLTAVNNLAAQVVSKRVKLTWSPVSGAEGYLIYRQIGSGAFEYVYMTGNLSYIDSKCSGNEYNFYRVYAYYKSGDKIIPGAAGKYVYSKPMLKPVVKVEAEATGTREITLSWSKVTGAEGYLIIRALQSDESVESIGDTMGESSTQYIDYSPSIDEWNFYAVVPYFIDGRDEIVYNEDIKDIADVYAISANVVKEQITGYESYSEAYKVLNLVNKERASRGLQALVMDQDLMDAAMQRAAETVVLFDHTRPSGYSCFTVTSKAFGENIAYGSMPYYGAEEIMDGWMNSEGHRANILGDYETIGIGCFQYEGVALWVQLFGGGDYEPASRPADRTCTRTVLVNSSYYGVTAASADMSEETSDMIDGLTIEPNETNVQETISKFIREYDF